MNTPVKRNCYIILTSIIILYAFVVNVQAGSSVIIEGTITDLDSGKPLDRVTIMVPDAGITTITNSEGFYRIRLKPGKYEFSFTHVSHLSQNVSIEILTESITRNIAMEIAVHEIGDIKVYSRNYDAAQAIIVEAIKRKEEILNRLHDYSFDAYLKIVVSDVSNPDSSEIFMIAESQTTVYWEYPDHFKEIITARRQTANLDPENVLISVGEFLNFNRNRIELGSYHLVSPTARDALDHYDYYLLDSLYRDGRLVFRLEIEPKNKHEALFVGEIEIADSTFDVVSVDVGTSDGFKMPFISNMRYSQMMALFDGKYWMPVEVKLSADASFGMPLPGIPSKLSFYYLGSPYSYRLEKGIEKGTFDEFALEVDENADDVDSTTWASKQTVALTSDEDDAYKIIDSTESIPEPVGKRIIKRILSAPLLALNGDPYFRFNRVEGAYFGGAYNFNQIRRANLHLQSGYATEAEKWQHRYSFRYRPSIRKRQYIEIGYHDEIIRPSRITTSYNPTMTALAYRIDPYDYYLEKGFDLKVGSKVTNRISGSINYNDLLQYSVPVTTDYGFIGDKADILPNRLIDDGHLRSIGAELRYDSRPLYKDKDQIYYMRTNSYLIIQVGVEHSSPDFIESNFDFTQYQIELRAKHTMSDWGTSSLFVYAGESKGNLPAQRDYGLDNGDRYFFKYHGLNTLDESILRGDRAALVYANHNFGRRLLMATNIKFLQELNVNMSLHGGVAWSEYRNDNIYRDYSAMVAIKPYSEVGFGLSNLTPFLGPINLATHFTWQLSDYETSKFKFNLGIQFD